MPEKIIVSETFPVKAEQVYRAWLDSKAHAAFTGASAKVVPKVGGKFSAWDGYIGGKTLELEPNHRIVQSWRTTDFPEGAEDSMLEVVLEETKGKTKVTLAHSNIPEGQGEGYAQGWREFYFEPMKKYFSRMG